LPLRYQIDGSAPADSTGFFIVQVAATAVLARSEVATTAPGIRHSADTRAMERRPVSVRRRAGLFFTTV
jgi:uncharacterized MAPEG superfamily protein